MLVAMDVDGTIDSDPQVFQTLAAALRQAGCQVAVLTGLHGTATITPADTDAKASYLADLGYSAYSTLVVFPDNGDIAQLKADWCKQHGVDLLIDNDRGNAQAAQDICLVLVPWQTRQGSKKDGVAKAATIRVVNSGTGEE